MNILVYAVIDAMKGSPSITDLSDLGNIIGRVISRLPNYNHDIGFDKDSFYAGCEHGLSLGDGTHDFRNVNREAAYRSRYHLSKSEFFHTIYICKKQAFVNGCNPRLEVQSYPGENGLEKPFLTISIHKTPRILSGQRGSLTDENLIRIKQFIQSCYDALLLYWNGEIGSKTVLGYMDSLMGFYG